MESERSSPRPWQPRCTGSPCSSIACLTGLGFHHRLSKSRWAAANFFSDLQLSSPLLTKYSQPRKSLPFGFWAQISGAHPEPTGSRPGPCHSGHTPQKAICSCKKPFPNYQVERSIFQTRHMHTHHRSIPSSSRAHYRSRVF